MNGRIEEVEKIGCFYPTSPDDIFICCASWEERCLGTLHMFTDYRFRNGYIFVYDDPNEQREHHLR
ncbi:hypothetical protein KA005_58825, partial [bacterium]|nr:hypothetical protein [bacterium]